MIKSRESLSMAEAEEYLRNNENVAELSKFIKKFMQIDPKKAKELRKNLLELNLMKLKQYHASKIIDILPENAEDLNKIFADTGLDENEVQKILDTVKQFIK
jgi:DNA-directed RNA polymerase subunit F